MSYNVQLDAILSSYLFVQSVLRGETEYLRSNTFSLPPRVVNIDRMQKIFPDFSRIIVPVV